MKKLSIQYEVLFWSIALPGFGQFLNKKYIKAITLIILEVLINVQSHFNSAIWYSFQWEIEKAIEVTNFPWLMFYPCFYLFSIWDAFRDAQEDPSPFSFFPFVFGAYFVTVGLMYSTKIKLFGVLLGPVFLPMLFLLPGLLTGYIIRKIILQALKRTD